MEPGLSGVSCPSAGRCLTVGTGTYATSFRSWAVGFDEIWDGRSWRFAAMPGAVGMLRVSCAAASRCVAAGDAPYEDSQRAAALTWTGYAWAVTAIPAPGNGQSSMFMDVTCRSAADCVAVGQQGRLGSPYSTGLTGFWSGKSWRLVTAR